MIKFFFILLSSISFVFAAGHDKSGTHYGEHGVHTYAQTKHGPDGALFLDPYFLPWIQNLHGKMLLDAGCGAGPWAVLAAQNGAEVYGIDIQSSMIEKANKAAQEAHVEKKTHFCVGDVAQLPYQKDFFDEAISLNVGCNLPALEKHIAELSRVMKRGGLVVVTAPLSFGTVFTEGKRPNSDVVAAIQERLSHQKEFPQSLGDLNEVYRATFAKRGGKWTLIQDESQLVPGEEIWRKIPNMMVPNRYHSESEYVALFKKYGFGIKKAYHPHFKTEAEREKYNKGNKQKLGPEYIDRSPFVIFVVEKIRSFVL